MFFAAVLAFVAPSFAFADQCDFSDAGQAFSDLGKSAPDFLEQCSDESDDEVYWALTIFLTANDVAGSLQQTPDMSGPTPITQFCTTALNDINSGVSTTVQDVVNQLPDSIKQASNRRAQRAFSATPPPPILLASATPSFAPARRSR